MEQCDTLIIYGRTFNISTGLIAGLYLSTLHMHNVLIFHLKDNNMWIIHAFRGFHKFSATKNGKYLDRLLFQSLKKKCCKWKQEKRELALDSMKSMLKCGWTHVIESHSTQSNDSVKYSNQITSHHISRLIDVIQLLWIEMPK